jgi:hypothetical protein
MKRTSLIGIVVAGSLLLTNTGYATHGPSKIPLPSAAANLKSNTAWSGHYGLNPALSLYGSGIWNPIKDHSPNDTMKQGEFVDLLVKATGNEIPLAVIYDRDKLLTRSYAAKWIRDLTNFNTGIANPTPSFPDMTGNKDVDSAIQYVYATGIMMGDGTRFLPDQPMTRGQAAVVLQKVLSYMPQMARNLSFEKLEGDLPETLYTLYQENKTEPGLYSVIDGGSRYILVNGGQQGSAGYSVTIDAMEETANAIYVKAALHTPEPDDIVAEVLTYPFAAVKIQDTKKPVYLLP